MKRATLALITRDGRVLLGRKKEAEIGTGTWNGPGGKMEEGETPLACVIRETYEEVGVTLHPDSLTEIATILFTIGGEKKFLVHVFRTDTHDGDPVESDEMVPAWHAIDALPYEEMLESDAAWFPKALSGEPFAARVAYKEKGPYGPAGFLSIEFLPHGTALD